MAERNHFQSNLPMRLRGDASRKGSTEAESELHDADAASVAETEYFPAPETLRTDSSNISTEPQCQKNGRRSSPMRNSDEETCAADSSNVPQSSTQGLNKNSEDLFSRSASASTPSSSSQESLNSFTAHAQTKPTRINNLLPGSTVPDHSFQKASELDDRDDCTPYNVEDEKAPEEPYYRRDFQAAFNGGKRLAQDIYQTLNVWNEKIPKSAELNRFLSEARTLNSFETSEKKTIAVLGDSGEGKSSLINSLLHCPDVAKTGDIGEACTTVVTEYRQKRKSDVDPFVIEIEHLSPSGIEELVKELIWSYRQLYLPGTQDLDAKEFKKFERESEQAWSALEAAFGNRDEFTQEFLKDQSDGSELRVTQTLLQWCTEIEWPKGHTGTLFKSTANTADECCERTAAFMEDRLWPFTKVIRVFLDAQILRSGIVLADLPSLHDTNLARVRATETYLLRCDYIFIVARISRAITDQSLQSSLYSVLNRHVPHDWEKFAGKHINVAVVCTKSEDLDVKQGKRWFAGPGKPISYERVNELERSIENAKKRNDRMQKKGYKRRLEFMFIEARNNHVKKGLQRAYATKVPGKSLEVFCVSNKAYVKYSKSGLNEYVQASGIPQLRRFCRAIPAESRFQEADHFLRVKIPSLIASIELLFETASSGVVEENHEMQVQLSSELAQLEEEVSDLVSATDTDIEQCFYKELYGKKKSSIRNWQEWAEMQSRGWQTWHHTQYSAWCRNNGTHVTRLLNNRWNAEIIQAMRDDQETSWDVVEQKVSEGLEDLQLSAEAAFSGLKSAAKEQFKHRGLVKSIALRAAEIRRLLHTTGNELMHKIFEIRLMASEDNATSYILREMVPTYRKAACESGTGSWRRQISIVDGKITSKTIFPNILAYMENDLRSATELAFDDIAEGLENLVAAVSGDFDVVVSQRKQSQDGHSSETRKPQLSTFEKDQLEGFQRRLEGILRLIS